MIRYNNLVLSIPVLSIPDLKNLAIKGNRLLDWAVFFLKPVFLFTLGFLVIGYSAKAQSETHVQETYVPKLLKPWADWVLEDKDTLACPLVLKSQDRLCAWPGRLTVTLDEHTARFNQEWTIYGDSWIQLPGSAKSWPLNVSVNQTPVPVRDRLGVPEVQLKPGQYRINGEFSWLQRANGLKIPDSTGLITLVRKDGPLVNAIRDKSGMLWFGDQSQKQVSLLEAKDRLHLKVFRKLTDDFPMTLETLVQLNLSGREREITTGTWLLAGFEPLEVDSPLPIRLEENGSFTIQARAGQWDIHLKARATGQPSSLRIDPLNKNWPKEEIWSFQAQYALRTLQISGVESVDPKQVSLPAVWQHLPAYLLTPEKTLSMQVEHRGDPNLAPNHLSIDREFWLDFSGRGYTVKDQISGQMKQGWRLMMHEDYKLGRAELNGNPQLITRLATTNSHGVESNGTDSEGVYSEGVDPHDSDSNGLDSNGIEVREGQIRLEAISRIENRALNLPASGWLHDFEQASARLYLPPGWSLFAATGVDRAQGAWVQRWSLWTIFLVLIIAVSTYKVLGWQWSLVAGLALLLSVHSSRAPLAIWLNLLAVIALLPLLPVGRFRRVLQFYRYMSFILLFFILVPYVSHEVKSVLYPQLEKPIQQRFSSSKAQHERASDFAAPGRQTIMDDALFAEPMAESMVSSAMKSTNLKRAKERTQHRKFKQYDQAVQVQTGPGVPHWKWNSHKLAWSGPLSQSQPLTLWLVSPVMNRLWNLLEVALVLLFAAGLVIKAFPLDRIKQKLNSSTASNMVIILLVMIGVFGLNPPAAYAEYPPKYLLEDLEQRLTQPPDCNPNCATVTMANIQITENQTSVELMVDALANTAIPLPIHEQHWLPRLIRKNGQNVNNIYRDKQGQLWMSVNPGRHQVQLSGPVNEIELLQLPFPLKPYHIRVKATGWHVSGMHKGQLRGDALQLHREKQAVQKQVEKQQQFKVDIPPFVSVERTVHLDLDWFVETRVTRIAPKVGSFSVRIPLIAGESITSEAVKQEAGEALVNFGARQTSVRWRSILPRTENILLSAVNNPAWYEVWRLDTGPQWHVRYQGLAPIKQTQAISHWLPQWRPYPNEKLKIQVVRPESIVGPTVTVQQAKLAYRPGQRTSESTLELSLLSSQGGDFEFALPDEAVLQSVQINGKELPIQTQNQRIKLPLTPAKQAAKVVWRTKERIGSRLTTPHIDLGVPATNVHVTLYPAKNRWPLWVSGPTLGPAILYWGVFVVVVIIAVGLSFAKHLPVRRYEWVLLGIGMSTSTILASFIVIAWFFAMAKRSQTQEAALQSRFFNLSQVGLVLMTLAAVSVLMVTIPAGLLWNPSMYVAGNGSYQTLLQWYQDRSAGALPQGTLISLPLWSYRLFMLVWSLWLAFALLRWAKWGWQCFSCQGLWSKQTKLKKDKRLVVEANNAEKGNAT